MVPNQYGGQSNMADITKTFNISYIELNNINEKAQDNTYIKIGAKPPIKSNLLYKCWFTEDSETVLKDVISGKPNRVGRQRSPTRNGLTIK